MATIKSCLVALVAAAGLLPLLTLAAPVNNLEKRKLVIETVTDTVWTTIDLTTTVYEPNYTPPAHHKSASAAHTTADGGQFFDRPSEIASTTSSTPFPSTTEAPPPPPSTTAARSSPPASTTPAPQPSSSSSVAAPAPAPSSSPAAQPQAQVASSNTGSTGGGSPNGQCTESSPCTGDITFYEAGLGACGTTADGSTEDVVALPHGLMGAQSNGNPFCGLKVTIKNGGKTASGTVGDKCQGCDDFAIDLSNHLYDQLADESAGRVHNVEWFFD